jgi:hypothetical protein
MVVAISCGCHDCASDCSTVMALRRDACTAAEEAGFIGVIFLESQIRSAYFRIAIGAYPFCENTPQAALGQMHRRP